MIGKNTFFTKLRNTPFHFLVVKVFQKTLGKVINRIRLRIFLKKKYFIQDELFLKKTKFVLEEFKYNKKDFFIDYPPIIKGPNSNSDEYIISNKKEILECADNICDHKIDILDIKNTDVSLKTSFRSKTDKVRSQNQQYPDYLRSKNSIKKIISDLSKTYDDERESEYLLDYEYEPVDWHIDFKSGHRWSMETWYKSIKYGQPGVDIKIPWELSRSHHIVRLGQAYVLTKDEKYTREFIYQLADWSINNPPGSGVNWFCPMEIAIRACNWIAGFQYFKSSRLFKDKIILEFCKNILIAGMHIFNNLEEKYSRVKTNHYLSDIAGLLYIGIFFKNSKIGKKWIEFAIRELKKQMNTQVYNDGCDYEASTCYHRLVLELFFYSTLTAIKSSETFKGDNYIEEGKKIFGEEYIEKLYKMFEVVKFVLKPDGTMPQIGDNDDGRMHIFGTEGALDMRYLLDIASIFFKDSKFKIEEFGPGNSASWIFGEKGKAVWDGLQGSSLETIKSTALSDSGWYIMRNKTDYMALSCGPNGQNGNGGHAHNDKLSFELFIDDRAIVIDSGTFTYTADSELRNRFRSTSFHNALIIDKAEQNRFTGENVFTLSDDSKINIEKWKSGKDYDYLSAKLISINKPDGINYQKRQVYFDKKNGIWLIRDIVEGGGIHGFDLYFHLDKNTECIIEDNMNISILRKKHNNIKIFPVITEGLEVLIEDGEISESYGKITKSKVLKFSKTGRAPAEFIFLISKSDIQNIEEYTKSILKVFNK